MDYKDITKNAYNQIVRTYFKENDHENVSGFDKRLAKLINYSNKKNLKNSKLLELGYGTGRDVKHFIHQGLKPENYTGIDISEEMSLLARNKYPSFTFLTGDITQYPYSKNTYDFLWAMAVFLHLSPEDTKSTLIKISESLKKNGAGVISMRVKQGRDDRDPGLVSSDKEGKIIQRYFAYYSVEDFKTLVESSNLKVIEIEREFEPDRKTEFMFVYVKRK